MTRGRGRRLVLFLGAGLLLVVTAVLLLDYRTVTVEYTASLDGNLDGCDCWGDPVAGLVKRAVHHRGNDGPDLLLDAGNSLPPGRDLLLSRHILNTYVELGYDRVALGDQELSKGEELLAEYIEEYPLGSENVTLAGRESFPTRPLTRDVNGLRLSVITLTGPEAIEAYPPEATAGITLSDPVARAAEAVQELAGGPPDHLFILYHGSRDGARRVATANPAAVAVIYGHEEESRDEILPNGVRLLSPGKHGNTVASLKVGSVQFPFADERTLISVRTDSFDYDYLEDPDDPAVRERVASYEAARAAALQSKGPSFPAEDASENAPEDTLVAKYFYSPSCSDCRTYLQEQVPSLLEALGGGVEVWRKNILNPGVAQEFSDLLGRLESGSDEFPIVVVNEWTLQGQREIEEKLEPLIRTLRAGEEPDGIPRLLPPGRIVATPTEKKLSLLPVVVAGLLDGINPCVFTALVFLSSSLLLLGKRPKELIPLGALFILTVYVTYFLVGLGLFSGLRAAGAFPTVSRALRYGLAGALILLAGISLRDAWIVKRTGNAHTVLLKLPKNLERRIHLKISSYRRGGALLGGTVLLGFLISLFELGCTGQIYLPTLAFYANRSIHAFVLLAFYNLAFVLPLIGVFFATLMGVRTSTFRRAFAQGLPALKLGVGVLFLGYAMTIIFI